MPDNSHSAFGRKKTALVAALAAGVLLVFFGSDMLGGNDEAVEDRPAQETIGWPVRGFFGSAASAVMYRLGIPAKSSDPTPIEIRPLDGNSPELVSTSFSSKSSLEQIEQFYEASCQRLGLELEPPTWSPERFCGGYFKGQLVSVHVDGNCKNGICKLFLEVSGI